MSSLYKFDTSTTPIVRYEWDHGQWQHESLSRNETLVLNDDGTVTLTKTYPDLVKKVVFALTADTSDDPAAYVELSESYFLPDGTATAEPGDTADDDGIEDDQDGDGSNDDHLDGTGGNDREHGGAGDDVLDGADGDDLLAGDQGDDHLDGGNGNDLLAGGVGYDVLSGGAGNDNLKGEADDDVLDGGAGTDKLDGGTGNDELHGGDGNDQEAGGSGDDSLDGGAGNDNLNGGNGNDQLAGGSGDDLENGGAGDDRFDAGSDAGNDRLIGAAGNDTVNYAGATAAVSVDLARGSAKAVSTDAGIGTDALSAIENAEGGDFDDLLTGSAQDNRLTGGAGNDTLTGGAGADTLSGGAGNDLFKFLAIGDSGLGIRHDVVTDFASGDRIDLSAIDAKAGFTRNDSFTLLADAPTLASCNGAVWFKDGVLYASTDADVAPEIEIVLTGVAAVSADDLAL